MLEVMEFASCFWEGRPPCRPLPMRERPAELSALGASRIYCYVISKVIADDTEVVPPRQISPVNDDKPFLMRCINMLVAQRSSRARHCPAPQPSA